MMTDVEFTKCARFFEKLKILHGPEFVNATLNRHKKLNNALLEYERCVITELESNVLHEE